MTMLGWFVKLLRDNCWLGSTFSCSVLPWLEDCEFSESGSVRGNVNQWKDWERALGWRQT